MTRMSEHYLSKYGTEGVESAPRRSDMVDTPNIGVLAQNIPPNTDPEAQLQWAIEMMGHCYQIGDAALKKGAVYRNPHPLWESAPSIYMRFLKRVEDTREKARHAVLEAAQ